MHAIMQTLFAAVRPQRRRARCPNSTPGPPLPMNRYSVTSVPGEIVGNCLSASREEDGDLMLPIRVLIVDDSVLIRQVLSEALQDDPEIEIAGIASSGEQALSLIPRLRPSLVTLDLALPGLNGLKMLAEIRKLNPTLPVIVISAFTDPQAKAAQEASVWGATDYITKPNQRGSRQAVRQQFRDELIPKIKLLCAATASPFTWRTPAAPAPRESASTPIDIVAIGASTGGPEALAELIAKLPADFPVPILIVQHMPAKFTRHLAERLDLLTPLLVLEGKAGKRLGRGQVWVAPGDYHMTVARQGSEVVLATNQHPTEQGCRPSVDVLFRSLAETFGAHVLAVVLTGMGSDGANGAQAVRDAGGEVFVQDEATSAIWGMPGRVVAAGLAHRIFPLGTIASEIVHWAYADRRLPVSAFAAAAESRVSWTNKKRLERKRSRRLWQPSPRTAKLPAHPMSGWPNCKCHFRNVTSR